MSGPATTAAIGFTILFVLQTAVLLNYLATGSLRWLSSYSGWISIGLLPIGTGVFLAILFFFISFHNYLVSEQASVSIHPAPKNSS